MVAECVNLNPCGISYQCRRHFGERGENMLPPRHDNCVHTVGKKTPTDPDDHWDAYFQCLAEYRHLNGNCLVPYSDKRLGKWVCRQKVLYMSGIIREDRREKLDSLNFASWAKQEHEIAGVRKKTFLESCPRSNKEWDTLWEVRFQRFAAIRNGSLGVGRLPRICVQELRAWAILQKQMYNAGVMQEHRRKKLESIGFVSPVERTHEGADYNTCNKDRGASGVKLKQSNGSISSLEERTEDSQTSDRFDFSSGDCGGIQWREQTPTETTNSSVKSMGCEQPSVECFGNELLFEEAKGSEASTDVGWGPKKEAAAVNLRVQEEHSPQHCAAHFVQTCYEPSHWPKKLASKKQDTIDLTSGCSEVGSIPGNVCDPGLSLQASSPLRGSPDLTINVDSSGFKLRGPTKKCNANVLKRNILSSTTTACIYKRRKKHRLSSTRALALHPNFFA
jgi:hypothetical protein